MRISLILIVPSVGSNAMASLTASSAARNVKQVLNKCGAKRSEPVRAAAMAKAQTLAWLLAKKADFGISPELMASPTTWIPGCSFDSKVVGPIGHQPDWS